MVPITLTPSESIPDLNCLNCHEKYKYDPLMGWSCLVLLDQRSIPHTIVGSWCDEACLKEWIDTKEAKGSSAHGM